MGVITIKYRPEIDGLRALAVLPVILFHAGFELFSGGFVGVDIFFVISGYLITTILIEDIEQNRFSLINFYERRARRLLPALFFVMLVCIPLAWVLLHDESLNKFGSGLIGISLFISNIVFWQTQGYFSELAELNPLLHTWSLAVEEQYYILFPIFLFLAWRAGKNIMFWVIVLFAIISLALSEWGWRNQAVANFYLAPTRAWELFAGSIAAFIVLKRGVQSNNFFSLTGVALIILSIFAYDKTTPFPSLYALVPVVGVVLLILYADKSTFAARLLSMKVFVGLGLISYSAYLWHQPLFAFFRIHVKTVDIALSESITLIIITFVIALLSWKIVELPFRNRQFLTTKTTLLLSVVSLLLLCGAGYFSKLATKGHEHRLAAILAENEFVYFGNMNDRKFVEGRLKGNLNKVDHIFVGSSRIMQINSTIMGEKILNLSVGGASIEDDVAFLLEAVAKLGPKAVYIGVDPWLLNKDGGKEYKSIKPLYDYWMNVIQKPGTSLSSAFFSNPNHATKTHILEKLIKSFRSEKTIVPKSKEVEVMAKKAYDGSHIYGQAIVNLSKNTVWDSDILLNYAMKNFVYDDIAKNTLVNMVEYLKTKGVKVTFVLSPYHPFLYSRIKNEKPIFLDIEREFKKLATDHNISVLGSYDPSNVGCTDSEFYDGMHPKSECLKKFIYLTPLETERKS